MKTIEQHFVDWESNTFGYGYGSGEEHVLSALKSFLAAIPEKGGYEHLERVVTPTVAWLLINVLAHDDKLEYGTSPRYAWLTDTGRALAQFVRERSAEQLAELTVTDENYIHCYPDHCNCDDGDCRPRNPFWKKR